MVDMAAMVEALCVSVEQHSKMCCRVSMRTGTGVSIAPKACLVGGSNCVSLFVWGIPEQ